MLSSDEDEPDETTQLFKKVSSKHSITFALHDKGGITDQIPPRAYCLIFKSKSKKRHYHLENKNDSLWQVKEHANTDERKEVDLLSNFCERNINYVIRPKGRFFYVLVSISDKVAFQWIKEHEFDIEINPKNTVEFAKRERKAFFLAQNTALPNEDTDFWIEKKKYKKLDISLWNHIHIEYNPFLAGKGIYEVPILTDVLYLRVLFEILTSDETIGGANCEIVTWLSQKKHPIKYCFALNDLSDDADGDARHTDFSDFLTLSFFTPSTWLEHGGRIDEIRDYYGEHVAFYFLFTICYTKWLLYILPIGIIWMIVQLSMGRIEIYGSTAVTLFTIIWSTTMTESWFRTEWKYRYQWGMVHYTNGEIPQSTFEGVPALSETTGVPSETYASQFKYFGRIMLSVSTLLFAIAIVISCVASIWILKEYWSGNTYYIVALGVINAVQIQILNQVYTRLALRLNEWENHKYTLEAYNALVTKRISFIVVNSFNSLFYIAFYEGGFKDQETRLYALRVQLITLFCTAIFIQNSTEILIPIMMRIVNTRMFDRKERKYKFDDEDDDGYQTFDTESDFSVNSAHETKVWDDVKMQMNMDRQPNVLDNTSEIVVLHGYVVLFVVVLPAMPLLCFVNNFFELTVDYYNLLHTQRAYPTASSGIGVWKQVLSNMSLIAVFSNCALLAFRTSLVTDYVGHHPMYKIIWFFAVSIVLVAVMLIIRAWIPDVSTDIQKALRRQGECQKHLVRNPSDKKKKNGISMPDISPLIDNVESA